MCGSFSSYAVAVRTHASLQTLTNSCSIHRKRCCSHLGQLHALSMDSVRISRGLNGASGPSSASQQLCSCSSRRRQGQNSIQPWCQDRLYTLTKNASFPGSKQRTFAGSASDNVGLQAAADTGPMQQQQQQLQQQQSQAAVSGMQGSTSSAAALGRQYASVVMPPLEQQQQLRVSPLLAWLPPPLLLHLQSLLGFLRACWELLPQFIAPGVPEALRRLVLVLGASLVMIMVVSTIDSGWLYLYLLNARRVAVAA